MIKPRHAFLTAVAVSSLVAAPLRGQSSSLYIVEPAAQASGSRLAAPSAGSAAMHGTAAGGNGATTSATATMSAQVAVPTSEGNGSAGAPLRSSTTLAPAVASASLMAVSIPEPKKYSVHDLVTIVVRESTTADSESTLDTKKTVAVKDAVTEFPNLDPSQLAKLMIGGGKLKNGPSVAVNSDHEFKGDGTYTRKDTLTSRLTAQIIDIKPNGTMVLEARKFIQSDKETLNIVLTGTCRKDDIASDNTVLSTQLYDLRLNKEHTGEVKNAAKKGLITQFLELLFNF